MFEKFRKKWKEEAEKIKKKHLKDKCEDMGGKFIERGNKLICKTKKKEEENG